MAAKAIDKKLKRIEGKGFVLEYDPNKYNMQIESSERGTLQISVTMRGPRIIDFFDEPEKYQEVELEGWTPEDILYTKSD